MKCDLCNKKATVHLTEIVDEQMSEMHLCEECAKEKSVQMEQQFGLADLLAGLTEFGKQPKGGSPEALSCSNCGLSYDDFRKFGRLGCGQCYESFKDHLGVLLKKIHGSNSHLGKKMGKKATATKTSTAPEKTTKKKAAKKTVKETKAVESLDDLQEQLQVAIESEDFEQAAILRDKIRAMKEKKD